MRNSSTVLAFEPREEFEEPEDLGLVGAGSVSGVTITGGTVQTAASGYRAEMSDLGSGVAVVRIYDSGGNLVGQLSSWGFTAPYLLCNGNIDVYGGISQHGVGGAHFDGAVAMPYLTLPATNGKNLTTDGTDLFWNSKKLAYA